MLKPNFTTKKIEENSSYGKFVLSPLPAGFGHTLGNAFRRTLLASIPGLAITYLKINDISHPFTTIAGVRESALDIILNLKLLRFKATGQGPFTMELSLRGVSKITGADFKGGNIDVVNKKQQIAEITAASGKLEIELTVEWGEGFSPSEEKTESSFGRLAIDSVFSPVKKINYTVEGARVGRKTNFDKLNIEIWTDESIMPSQALKKSSSLLAEYFDFILSGRDAKKEEEKNNEVERSDIKVDGKVYQTIIDELDLPTRVINALLREQIETVEDLIKRGKKDLVNLKGVGRKSLDLIEKELEKLGIPFIENEA